MSPVRSLFRPADQLGQTLEEARRTDGGRLHPIDRLSQLARGGSTTRSTKWFRTKAQYRACCAVTVYADTLDRLADQMHHWSMVVVVVRHLYHQAHHRTAKAQSGSGIERRERERDRAQASQEGWVKKAGEIERNNQPSQTSCSCWSVAPSNSLVFVALHGPSTQFGLSLSRLRPRISPTGHLSAGAHPPKVFAQTLALTKLSLRAHDIMIVHQRLMPKPGIDSNGSRTWASTSSCLPSHLIKVISQQLVWCWRGSLVDGNEVQAVYCCAKAQGRRGWDAMKVIQLDTISLIWAPSFVGT